MQDGAVPDDEAVETRIAILISGRGSNMKSIVRAVREEEIPNARVVCVISNRADAPGIGYAADRGIDCIVIRDMEELGQRLRDVRPDIVCMAGFMRIVPPEITGEHPVLNIHPSLLPLYPGLHAQRQAIRDGAGWSGCTVHYADDGVDTGPIIVQYAVPVLPGDTEESLSGRILEREHVAYPHAIRLAAQDLAARRRADGGGADPRR